MHEYRIGVATAKARPYYTFVSWLRAVGAPFDVIKPDRIPSYDGDIVLTTRNEAPGYSKVQFLYADELEDGPTLAQARLLNRCGADAYDDTLVVGVDPGKLLGLSISYADREIERSLFSSAVSLVGHLCDILLWDIPSYRIVRIGNGDMMVARRIASMLSRAPSLPPFRIELVDEAFTSPRSKNCNQRGKRDMLAARAISHMEGLGEIRPSVATAG